MKTAIYPGSFDPITLGHLNIIKRAARCFDKLIVCVMVNSQKNGLFTPEERVELIRKVVSQLPNVEVDASSVLLAEYARQRRARVIVKGLRAMSDFESEVQMAVVNRKLNPNVDTMFLPGTLEYVKKKAREASAPVYNYLFTKVFDIDGAGRPGTAPTSPTSSTTGRSSLCASRRTGTCWTL